MAPLICPSPVILDHSFPRSEEELQRVAITLGELQAYIESGAAEVLITEALIEFVHLFDTGTGPRPYGLVNEIYGLLDSWLLAQPRGVVRLSLAGEAPQYRHPVPAGAASGLFVDEWSTEVGKLFCVHERVRDAKPFVGVACDHSFTGGTRQAYVPPTAPALPLVGPDSIRGLDDGWMWMAGTEPSEVTFAQAKQNIHLIGGKVSKPKGGSHYMVSFAGRRPWPLDRNTDPLPDRFLKQLVGISGYPLPVVKETLACGIAPRRVFRLASWVA